MDEQIIKSQEETSESLGALALALAKAQGQMEAASKNSANPFFKSKYADLAEVWEVIRKPLSSNGLAIIQTTSSDSTNAVVITRLVHESGEWIKGILTLRPTKPDAQGMGSAITYARRYAIAAMVGVVQEDDDANAASQKPTTTQPQKAAPVTPIVNKNPDKAKRVEDGIKKLGFTEAEGALLKTAFDDETLFKHLSDAFRKQDREAAKTMLLEQAEDAARQGGAA